MIPPVELGIEETSSTEKIAAFPNPAVNMLSIPFNNNKEGNATINIVDVTGKTVSTQVVNLTGINTLKLDVTSIEAGMYVFNVNYENDTTSTFNVYKGIQIYNHEQCTKATNASLNRRFLKRN